MRTSEKSSTIAAALYAVHRDLENPRKDAKGQVRGRTDYRYLSLPALIDHARAALKEAQVAVIQEVTGDAGQVSTIGVTTTFLHLTGEWVEVGPLMLAVPNDPQQAGSAITYARRYALAAALNLAADEDDDGSKASAKVEPPSTVTGSSEAGGMADAEDGGSGADGEAAPEPSQPVSVSDAQRYMDEFHAGKPHKMASSETVKGMKFCTLKHPSLGQCVYAIMVEGAKA